MKQDDVQRLAMQFNDLTDQMHELKQQERTVAARREQVALQLSETGLYLYQIGDLVGLAAPTVYRLTQKAKEKNALHGNAIPDPLPGLTDEEASRFTGAVQEEHRREREKQDRHRRAAVRSAPANPEVGNRAARQP